MFDCAQVLVCSVFELGARILEEVPLPGAWFEEWTSEVDVAGGRPLTVHL